RKIQALGSHAGRIPSYLPLGLNRLYRTLSAAIDLIQAWMSYSVLSMTLHSTTTWTSGPIGSVEPPTALLGKLHWLDFAVSSLLILRTSKRSSLLSSPDYGKGQRFHGDWEKCLGDSIFTTDGDRWQHIRRLIRPQFITERVSDLQLFERHVQRLTTLIANGRGTRASSTVPHGKDSRGVNVIDINDLFLRFTLDVATEFLLGTSVDSLESPRQDFRKGFR
ncbi:MAG: cytochrome P450 52A11, partial [Lasallia pustulata]